MFIGWGRFLILPLFFRWKWFVDLLKEREGLDKKFFELCLKVVIDEGLELYDMEYISGSGILRIYIMDQKTKTVDIKDCIKVDRALTPYIDTEDWMPNELRLEVSSPGVCRTLKTIKHFEMAVGGLVSLQLFSNEGIPESIGKEKKIKADLLGVNGDSIELKVGNLKFQLGFNNIKKANVEHVFQRE